MLAVLSLSKIHVSLKKSKTSSSTSGFRSQYLHGSLSGVDDLCALLFSHAIRSSNPQLWHVNFGFSLKWRRGFVVSILTSLDVHACYSADVPLADCIGFCYIRQKIAKFVILKHSFHFRFLNPPLIRPLGLSQRAIEKKIIGKLPLSVRH
jgi:hypothetical protein